MAEWYVVRLPKGTEFTHIKKEKDCQGRLILIYEEDGEDAGWLSQSMPAVVRAETTPCHDRSGCIARQRIGY